MTPKEKAEKLVSRYKREILRGKYRIDGFVIEELAEECAFIAVDEIFRNNIDESKHDYWINVKEEIEKL
jgi:hypothetical protein